MKNYIITLIILTISGCGGEDETSPQKKAVEQVPTTEVIKKTSDLISDPDFDFISSTVVDITLPVSPSTSISYFVNICTDFSADNNEVTINYNSCKLRTTLDTKEQKFTLTLSTTELLLIAQIWPIESGAQPINVYWNITDSGRSWKIEI